MNTTLEDIQKQIAALEARIAVLERSRLQYGPITYTVDDFPDYSTERYKAK